HEKRAKLRAILEGRLCRRSSAGRVTLICEDDAPTPEAGNPPDLIVSRRGPGRHLAQLFDSSDQITSCPLREPQPKAAHTRVGPIADCVGEIASFFGGRADRERVTRNGRALRL